MGIGPGIGLLLAGLVLVLRVVNVDLPWVDDYRLGVLLVVLGVVSLVLTLVAWGTARTRTRVIEHRRLDDPLR